MSAAIVLLCEDRQTDMFVRHLLRRRKFKGRDIKTCEMAIGLGSGEQWVRERFPREVQAIRDRKEAFLVVVIDADTGSTDARRSELQRECRKCGVQWPEAGDPVILAIPRRNIETWFEYLGGGEVDETIKYPKLDRERDCKPFARALYEMCHEAQRLRAPAPPSLVEACREYRKLKH